MTRPRARTIALVVGAFALVAVLIAGGVVVTRAVASQRELDAARANETDRIAAVDEALDHIPALDQRSRAVEDAGASLASATGSIPDVLAGMVDGGLLSDLGVATHGVQAAPLAGIAVDESTLARPDPLPQSADAATVNAHAASLDSQLSEIRAYIDALTRRIDEREAAVERARSGFAAVLAAVPGAAQTELSANPDASSATRDAVNAASAAVAASDARASAAGATAAVVAYAAAITDLRASQADAEAAARAAAASRGSGSSGSGGGSSGPTLFLPSEHCFTEQLNNPVTGQPLPPRTQCFPA